jgi:transcriptional regulator with GAF, ATPase, and Fis domain
MRTHLEHSFDSALGSLEASVLLVAAGRVQDEALRGQLIDGGFAVDVSPTLAGAFERLDQKRYRAVVLDWQVLRTEHAVTWREVWFNLVRVARTDAKPVGFVAVFAAGAAPLREVEQADAIGIAFTRALEPKALTAAVEQSIDLHTGILQLESHANDSNRTGAPAVESNGSLEKHVIGHSAAIRRVLDQLRLVAPKDTTVLITGETGTGKERISRAIHLMSRRHRLGMVSVNCGGIPPTLLEDEFFGHVKGAFTDARQGRVGRFEQAHGSTIFLDEIGDLPLELQPKLLRVLQEREIHRIGGVESIHLDVRVIAATNVDLWRRVEEARFREDLFYRINVYHIHIPPLRERREDIPLFIRYFLDKLCVRDGLPPKHLVPAVELDLMKRPWRGNIRELENAIEIAVIRSQNRSELTGLDFPAPREMSARLPEFQHTAVENNGAAASEIDFKTLMMRYERDLILRTLETTQGNKNKAARMLRLKRTTLIEKLKRFDAAT